MTEQQMQAKMIKYLESKGAFVVKVITSNKTGCPDLLVCYKGLFLAIEAKAPGKIKNATELQQAQLRKVREAGGTAIVADNLEIIKETLDEF